MGATHGESEPCSKKERMPRRISFCAAMGLLANAVGPSGEKGVDQERGASIGAECMVGKPTLMRKRGSTHGGVSPLGIDRDPRDGLVHGHTSFCGLTGSSASRATVQTLHPHCRGSERVGRETRRFKVDDALVHPHA